MCALPLRSGYGFGVPERHATAGLVIRQQLLDGVTWEGRGSGPWEVDPEGPRGPWSYRQSQPGLPGPACWVGVGHPNTCSPHRPSPEPSHAGVNLEHQRSWRDLSPPRVAPQWLLTLIGLLPEGACSFLYCACPIINLRFTIPQQCMPCSFVPPRAPQMGCFR